MSLRDGMEFLLRPLIGFHKGYDDGADIFRYLYSKRDGIESHVKNAIRRGKNMTIVGNAGQGKTSLMRYLYIDVQQDPALYPIFLDYRTTAPNGRVAFITEFVKELRLYFREIDRPIQELSTQTTLSNAYEHLAVATSHLDRIRLEHLTRRLVIFLDDLDYAEEEYIALLKEDFLPYAASDKVILILSARPPLLNTIREMDELCQYYHIEPQEVTLSQGDLSTILTNRLKTISRPSTEARGMIERLRRAITEPATDRRLREIMRTSGIQLEDGEFIADMPFDDTFFASLQEITNDNLRDVERLFPAFYEYETAGRTPSFHDAFHDAYIIATSRDANMLLDLVSERHSNIAILQNVLEYWYFHEALEPAFYDTMAGYKILRKEADDAIEKLTHTPHTMIEPAFVYGQGSNRTLCKSYKITRKGVIYVTHILPNTLYYSTERRDGGTLARSKRSYYRDHGRGRK